ncbi:alpha/beta fold hydrolase [Luteimonas yindakuii]|uniref:Alpha/beta fold hydrolase n=1 Tax=Luteimonas yindakuii TaxID=2565782 RepID=A0A4Z1RGF2_9GAMM|nr:alpha/beta fold hydrolase [Luteimonas yindakuii]TKS53189.1 alpha/beta fold hydrolase [Luteimonas yindakuii]
MQARRTDPVIAYAPPSWLRNAHLQSVLGSSGWRRLRGARALAATGAVTTAHLLDGGDGVRLLGLHSSIGGRAPRGLALLLHGWEGSAESGYMRLTAAHFLRRGFDVFRLNFRDHGPTHHLNEELFHSNRIDEVVHAARDLCARFPSRPLVAAGFSLGGNFALRVAQRAPAAGLPLAAVAAVCPVLDPALTLQQMERGMPLYLRHFERKWRESLLRKRALFPQLRTMDDRVLRMGMRDLTEWLVLRHTTFGSLDEYFAGYSIAGERLAGLAVSAHVLTSEDDPVIPADGFRALPDNPCLQVEIARWGGHCGFIENARLDGYAERWAVERLLADPRVASH